MQVSNLPVSIEQGHLHVGSDTYPLRNLARISLRSFTVKPPPPSRWVRLLIVIGGVGTLLTGFEVFRTDREMAEDGLIWFLASLGLLALGLFLLVKLRQRPRQLTVLRVVSSGTPYRALVSDDEPGLTELRLKMIAAINDLGVTYHTEFRSYDINAENYIGEVHAGGAGFVQQSN